jgi:hypothetical protein
MRILRLNWVFQQLSPRIIVWAVSRPPAPALSANDRWPVLSLPGTALMTTPRRPRIRGFRFTLTSILRSPEGPKSGRAPRESEARGICSVRGLGVPYLMAA